MKHGLHLIDIFVFLIISKKLKNADIEYVNVQLTLQMLTKEIKSKQLELWNSCKCLLKIFLNQKMFVFAGSFSLISLGWEHIKAF